MDDDIDDILQSALEEFEADEKGHPSHSNSAPLASPLIPPSSPQTNSPSTSTTTTTTSSSSSATSNPFGADDNLLDEVFEKEMAAHLAELEKSISQNPPFDPNSENLPGEMKKLLESFEKGPESEEMKKLIEGFEKSLGDGIPESEKEMEDLMEKIAEDLMTKEVLEQPMIALCKSYEEWLKEYEEKKPIELVEQVKKQQKCVQEICEVLSRSEQSQETKKMLMTLLDQMEQLGSPPDEIKTQCMNGNGFPDISKLAEGGGENLADMEKMLQSLVGNKEDGANPNNCPVS